MDFPLPTCAVSFRSTVGLDRVVGKGGCARAIVYAQKAEGQPLYRSDHLIGSDKVADTGVIPVNARVPDAQLVIVSHPDSSDRPAGADPLDIRDVVDWLEPQVNLDLEKLRTEVRKRLPHLLPGLEGWTISGGNDGRMLFANRWDKTTLSFHLEFRPEVSAVTLTRSIRIEPDQNWLMLYVDRNLDGNSTSSTEAMFKIDGKPVGEFDVTARWQPDPPPLQLPVDKFHDRQVTLEVRLVSRGDKSFVDWRSLAIVDRLPTLFEVFEDEVQRPIKLTAAEGEAAVTTLDRYSGTACIKVSGKDARGILSNLSLPVRENPRFGEYRWIRFVWRKSGGKQIGLDLDYLQTDDGHNFKADQNRRKSRFNRFANLPAKIRRVETELQSLQQRVTNGDSKAVAQIANVQKRLDRLKQSQRAESRPRCDRPRANRHGGRRSALAHALFHRPRCVVADRRHRRQAGRYRARPMVGRHARLVSGHEDRRPALRHRAGLPRRRLRALGPRLPGPHAARFRPLPATSDAAVDWEVTRRTNQHRIWSASRSAGATATKGSWPIDVNATGPPRKCPLSSRNSFPVARKLADKPNLR